MAPLCLDREDIDAVWPQFVLNQKGMKIRTQPVFLAGIRDARVLAGGLAIRSRDNFLFYEPFHEPMHVNCLRHPLLPSADRYLRGDYIHFVSLWWPSHFHWLLDVLPRLSIVEQFERLRRMPFLVPTGLTHQQRESLELLGIKSDQLIELNGNFNIERLYYPSTLSLSGNPTPTAVRWLRERFASRSRAQKKLYVSRRDASTRRIVNEDDLVRELVPFGFEVVSLVKMRFSEQIHLFSDAAIILGPNGAGLTNSLFAPPGATVVELFSRNYVNGAIWALANVCGHKYGLLVGPHHAQDIEVDIGKLLRLLHLLGISKH
jgi:hypothetical protein